MVLTATHDHLDIHPFPTRRSSDLWRADEELRVRTWVEDFRRVRSRRCYEATGPGDTALTAVTDWVYVDIATRSEEHTSELQSLRHLVCRLLHVKKRKKNTISTQKN